MSAARTGSTARNATSQLPIPSTTLPAAEKVTSPRPTPRRFASSRARSTETPRGSPVVASLPASTGLPKLIAARSVPDGASWTTASRDKETVMVEAAQAPRNANAIAAAARRATRRHRPVAHRIFAARFTSARNLTSASTSRKAGSSAASAHSKSTLSVPTKVQVRSIIARARHTRDRDRARPLRPRAHRRRSEDTADRADTRRERRLVDDRVDPSTIHVDPRMAGAQRLAIIGSGHQHGGPPANTDTTILSRVQLAGHWPKAPSRKSYDKIRHGPIAASPPFKGRCVCRNFYARTV